MRDFDIPAADLKGIMPVMPDQNLSAADLALPTAIPESPAPTFPPGASSTIERNLPDDDARDRLRLEFAPRIAQARERFRLAADEMRSAELALRDEGRPPSYLLVLALGECHRAFLRLRQELVRRFRAMSIPAPSSLDPLTGLDDLARWIDSLTGVPAELAPDPTPVVEAVAPPPVTEPEVAEPTLVETAPDMPEAVPDLPEAVPDLPEAPVAEPEPEVEHPNEAVRRSAMAVLDTVLRLRLRDQSEFPALNECQARARALREEIAAAAVDALPPDVNDLAAGEHPFDGLLSLIGGVSALSDARWASVHAQVAEAFGRQLAVAAARGRLVMAPPD